MASTTGAQGGEQPSAGASPSGAAGNPSQVVFEAVLAFAIIAGILVAVGDTKVYPVAFGVVIVALLYNLLENSKPLTDTVKWATKHL